MANPNSDLYAFDDFQLHAAERRLLHKGAYVPLPEKAFETLCVLVRNSNHLVTRETLLQEVWKDTIVEENNLAKNVSLLRKVLRQQADGREFIETVRGHGFRFTAGVNVLSAPEAEPSATGSSRSWPVSIALGVLLIAVLFLSYSAASPKSPAPSISSIAVLPFQNAGSDAELAYLSDGLSEGLIDQLSESLPELKVISRYSSFRYRGDSINLQEAAQELDVDGIITGTFVRRGDALSIRVELTDARSNRHVWGEPYQRTVSDVVGVLDAQREITRAVARTLRSKLAGEHERRNAEYTADPRAFEHLLRGRLERQKGSLAGHRKAIDYFKTATEADPNYGLAFAELSLSYSIGIGMPDPREAMTLAETAAVRALQIDDSLAEAHHSLGNIKLNRLDWAGAAGEFTRAIELNPSLARAHAGYANVLGVLGDRERALEESRKARELDPLLPRSDVQFAWALMGAGKVDQAIDLFNKSDFHRHENLGVAYCMKKMYREAATEFEQAIKAQGSNPSAQIYLGAAYAKAGDADKARAILRQINGEAGYVSPAERAVLLEALGDRNAAFASLNTAFDERDLQLQNLKFEPFFDDMRGDPRFRELLQRLALPQ